jgi:hypothetical protein
MKNPQNTTLHWNTNPAALNQKTCKKIAMDSDKRL